jgi:DNA invertase Pin-like site-specific DNA recombinase
MLREGDTLVVKSLDRLSRNKTDIRNELQYYKDNGIRVKVIDLPTTMMDLPEGQEWVFEMVNNILIEVLGTIAQQERETIKQRQAEGIAAAKENGKKLGRPALEYPTNWNEVYASWKAGSITAKEAMEQTGTKRTSFYKLVGMMENKQ